MLASKEIFIPASLLMQYWITMLADMATVHASLASFSVTPFGVGHVNADIF